MQTLPLERPVPKISGKSEISPSERDLMLSTGDVRPTPAPRRPR